MKLFCAFLALALVANARVSLTGIAAGTTIGVNVLTLKERYQQAKKAVHATKKAAVKAVQKVRGK